MSNVQSPVYDGFASPPPTYPLGVEIADKVNVREIDRRTADRVYQAHHSYLPGGRVGWHYGVYLDGEIVGAISFDNWPSNASIRGYESKEIIEVSRVCIGHDTANLASCAMSKAQDAFVDARSDIDLLVTYVREDYDGSMFKALSGKGWERDRLSEGSPPGNAPTLDIHEWNKMRWVCEL